MVFSEISCINIIPVIKLMRQHCVRMTSASQQRLVQVKPDQWDLLVSDTESATEVDMWDPVKADVPKSTLTGGPTVVSANLIEK